MAENPCDLSHLTSEEDGCEVQMSGTGTMAYIFNMADLKTPPTYDETNPSYFTDTAFDTTGFEEGKGAYKVELRNDANNIQPASVKAKKGFNQVATLVTDIISPVASKFMARLNNINHIGVLIETGTGEYYAMVNPQKKGTLEIAGDTGTASSDDSGYTMTYTQWDSAPLRYYKGTVAIAGKSPDIPTPTVQPALLNEKGDYVLVEQADKYIALEKDHRAISCKKPPIALIRMAKTPSKTLYN